MINLLVVQTNHYNIQKPYFNQMNELAIVDNESIRH